jgi:hypothetical protein
MARMKNITVVDLDICNFKFGDVCVGCTINYDAASVVLLTACFGIKISSVKKKTKG